MRSPSVFLPLLVTTLVASAAAQVSVVQPGARARAERVAISPPPQATAPARALRERFGVERAARLLRSGDPDDRMRGLERLSAIGSPEAVSMLVHAARDAGGSRRLDTRELLVVVRGLSDKTATSEVRQLFKDTVLGSLGGRPGQTSPETEPESEAKDARLAMARATAALALATSPDPRAVEAVLAVVKDSGPGQAAAATAIAASPPEQVATAVTGPASPALLRLAGRLGDLRALDAVRAALRATDGATRAAALDAMVEMADDRAVAAAGELALDAEPRVREAAARALVRLGAPARFRAVEALLGDPLSVREGVHLAEGAADGGLLKALAALAVASPDPEVAALSIFALGRSTDPVGLEALRALARDPRRRSDAAAALARSPAAGAEAAILALASSTPASPGDPSRDRRLAGRAYIVRAFTRGEKTAAGRALLDALAGSRDARDRGVGLSGLVLLGSLSPLDAIVDPDAGVRRAVATVAGVDDRESTRREILRLSASEPDPVARSVERGALLGTDAADRFTDRELEATVAEGRPEAPLAAMALAARVVDSARGLLDTSLAGPDPVLRAHVARGLGANPEASATGRLSRAYALEVDPLVRRAIVVALARRTGDFDSPSRDATLRQARRLDPDRSVRDEAARGLDGLAATPRTGRLDVAWLAAIPADGARAGEPIAGTLVRSDGLAVPIAFDADGYALAPVPPGDARLLLAPRIPVYEETAR